MKNILAAALITFCAAIPALGGEMHFSHSCVVKELGAGAQALGISVGTPASLQTTTGRESGTVASGPNVVQIGSFRISGTAGRYVYVAGSATGNIFEILGAGREVVVKETAPSPYTMKMTATVYIEKKKIAELACVEMK